MSDAATLSNESTDEAYSHSGHHAKYGLTQHQMTLREGISIPWTGSARALIRSSIEDAYEAMEPRGVALRAFERNETRVTPRTVPEVKALYNEITDELYRRQINDRQRNSLHRFRDELEAAYEPQIEDLRDATGYYNGNRFRTEGDFPDNSIAKVDVEIDAEVRETEFTRGRFRHFLGSGPSAKKRDHETREIEKAVREFAVAYGYEP